jgi:hypothetical protein
MSRFATVGRRAAEMASAGTVSALTAFPLSIGFALLAGVPAYVMILTSVYSAAFNATLGVCAADHFRAKRKANRSL